MENSSTGIFFVKIQVPYIYIYMKRCLLKGHNLSYWIYIKITFWWKFVYWKDIAFHIGYIWKVPFDENVPIKWKWCILKGYNNLGLNSGLYSLDNHFSFLSQKLVSKKHKKSCSYSLEFLSVEPNNLVVSWGQVCDNPLATRVWGQILFKDDNFVLPSYLFFYYSFLC